MERLRAYAILKHLICRRYPIVRSKPFHRCPRVDQAIFLQTLEVFLSVPDRIVFSGIEGHYNHWTLISQITEQTIQVYDSDDMRFLLKSSCSMIHEHEAKRHWLLAETIYRVH
jgi:hypothetical protein